MDSDYEILDSTMNVFCTKKFPFYQYVDAMWKTPCLLRPIVSTGYSAGLFFVVVVVFSETPKYLKLEGNLKKEKIIYRTSKFVDQDLFSFSPKSTRRLISQISKLSHRMGKWLTYDHLVLFSVLHYINPTDVTGTFKINA